jgi:hypothetical protein
MGWRKVRTRRAAPPRFIPPVLATHIHRRRTGLLLPQNPDNLFLREPCLVHRRPPSKTDSTYFWR